MMLPPTVESTQIRLTINMLHEQGMKKYGSTEACLQPNSLAADNSIIFGLSRASQPKQKINFLTWFF